MEVLHYLHFVRDSRDSIKTNMASLLSVQDYGDSDSTECEDSDTGSTDEKFAHLKPLTDKTHSVSATLSLVAAPSVVSNVSVAFLLLTA